MRILYMASLIACLTFAPLSSAGAAAATLHFTTFVHTNLRLTGMVWTGSRFLFVDNTTNRLFASGPRGAPQTLFATMPRQVEETRCQLSPGTHGFAPGAIFCHSPGNTIYRISPDGTQVSVFATLPYSRTSDGALAFDSAGTFGFKLVAATGRSGGPTPAGGAVFTIDPAGQVSTVGAYHEAGGADEAAIAPPSFGPLAGDILLTVDAGKRGTLVAMDAQGKSRIIMKLPDGPNSIAVLTSGQRAPAGKAQPGLYVTDTLSRNVFFAPASELAPYAGDVLVGTELRGLFWALRAQGTHLVAIPIPTTLPVHNNLEGATYIGG
jgi:hypothetical protein